MERGKTTVGGRGKNLSFGKRKKIDLCYWTRCSERKTRKNDEIERIRNTEQSKLFTASAEQGAFGVRLKSSGFPDTCPKEVKSVLGGTFDNEGTHVGPEENR